MKNFGSNIKKIRTEQRLSLDRLSKLSNVSVSMLSNIERGIKTPTIRVAMKIASALGKSFTELLDNPLKVLAEEGSLYGSSDEGIRALTLTGEKMDINAEYSDLDDGCPSLPFPMQLEVVSTDESDNSIGTGIQSVVIGFIDTTNVFNVEILELNGVTPVLLSSITKQITFFNANRIGSNKSANGRIMLRSIEDRLPYALINEGNNEWRSARIFIPKGWTFIITGLSFSTIGSPIKIELISALAPSIDYTSPALVRWSTLVCDSSNQIDFDVPIKVNEMCLFTVRARCLKAYNASAVVSVLGYYFYSTNDEDDTVSKL